MRVTAMAIRAIPAPRRSQVARRSSLPVGIVNRRRLPSLKDSTSAASRQPFRDAPRRGSVPGLHPLRFPPLRLLFEWHRQKLRERHVTRIADGRYADDDLAMRDSELQRAVQCLRSTSAVSRSVTGRSASRSGKAPMAARPRLRASRLGAKTPAAQIGGTEAAAAVPPN